MKEEGGGGSYGGERWKHLVPVVRSFCLHFLRHLRRVFHVLLLLCSCLLLRVEIILLPQILQHLHRLSPSVPPTEEDTGGDHGRADEDGSYRQQPSPVEGQADEAGHGAAGDPGVRPAEESKVEEGDVDDSAQLQVLVRIRDHQVSEGSAGAQVHPGSDGLRHVRAGGGERSAVALSRLPLPSLDEEEEGVRFLQLQ
eukprot:765221-Hanusia_phi.AAC.2